MALPLHERRPGDSDDDGSVAGEDESECPQRADIMLVIRLALFAKDDGGVHCSSSVYVCRRV